MKKVTKKLNKTKVDDIDTVATKSDIRQLGAMMEDMKDSISFVAETVVGLSEKVDNIEVKVDNMDKRLSRVEDSVEVIKSDISDIKFDLKKKVDREEFLILVKRVEKLEAKR